MQTVDCPAVTSLLGPPRHADVRRADSLAQCRETARPPGYSGKSPASSRVLQVSQHGKRMRRKRRKMHISHNVAYFSVLLYFRAVLNTSKWINYSSMSTRLPCR